MLLGLGVAWNKMSRVLDAPHADLLNRVSALIGEISPLARAGTDPALVDTVALCMKHRVLHLGGLCFALEEDLDVTLQVYEPDEPAIERCDPGRLRLIA